MMELQAIIRRLEANAEAIRLLVQDLSEEQAQWRPNPRKWSLLNVMEHLYNEERLDFCKHLKEMFSDPPQPWEKSRREDLIQVESCRQALEGFLSERKDSLAWLKALEAQLESPNWEATSQTPFKVSGEALALSAGDVLVSWVAHDHLHLRQINEILYAWNKAQALPYSVQYGGKW